MNAIKPDTPQQALDFAGYDYYILPEGERILAKQEPLPKGYERI